ncbi:MAG: carbohydrate porin [Sphingomonas sp.]
MLSGTFCLSSAEAKDDPPETTTELPTGVAVAVRDTFDIADALAGIDSRPIVLNKLQISATIHGEALGLDGWHFHAQAIRVDGQTLSGRLGDIQTADNIEAPHALRLFEAYLARSFGAKVHPVYLRAGMIDLNSQFDSTDPASLMINSSHGIAPDLSKSGVNGPSIFPFASIGTTATWAISPVVTLRAGVFDGEAGNPAKPHAFIAARLRPSNGVLAIGQVDWSISKEARLEAGMWEYSAAQKGPDGKYAYDHGAYISYEMPLPGAEKTQLWVRLGGANPAAQAVRVYIGGGVVRRAPLRSRPDDRLGIAIAHAIVSDRAVARLGLRNAETSLETTYQLKLSNRFVLQPDLDFIHHPAAAPQIENSLSFVLRFAFAIAAPARMQASDPGDPTVPPDGGGSDSN